MKASSRAVHPAEEDPVVSDLLSARPAFLMEDPISEGAGGWDMDSDRAANPPNSEDLEYFSASSSASDEVVELL